jgi:hypothetical protein
VTHSLRGPWRSHKSSCSHLEALFEREIEGLDRDEAENVERAAPPERRQPLLGDEAAEAVDDPFEPGHLPREDARVGGLALAIK